jgi:16S rRNA (cytosine967-C5)-methyltransferase
MVKPGGKLVYATCSVLPSENEDQVQKFLAKHGDDWTLEEEMKINPAESGHDGFYGARLVRKAVVVPETAIAQSDANPSADETPANTPETAAE